MAIRVLIADDSVLFRRVLTEVLTALPDVEVVGTAANGKIAIKKIHELKPDLLTLDMEMPELDGLGVLDELAEHPEKVAVIVVSALTTRGGKLTMQALGKGAFDFITKPDGVSAEQNREQIRQVLAPRIKALASRLDIRNILQRQSQKSQTAAPTAADATATKSTPVNNISERMQRLSGNNKPEIVLIGVSTGGPAALSQLLPALPASLGVPVLVVQHMPAMFTRSLAESLDSRCPLQVQEAVDGEEIQKNRVYFAPGGKQMKLIFGANGGKTLKITDDPPENNCKPAVDYLFRSVANGFPGQAMAVILTGMGSDGTKGLRMLKRHKCFTIAQNEESCVVYGMPKSAVEAGAIDIILPLEQIAGEILSTLRSGSS